jgi:cytochrome oxidase Cu insertion factor (SCO1/SenC/PrrC family)
MTMTDLSGGTRGCRRSRARALAALLVLLVLPGCRGGDRVEPVVLEDHTIGGDFELTDHRGEAFRLSDHRGKVALLFFGFTNCPDVCPTTLSTVAEVERRLGDDRDRLLTVFVSVDPERDTPEVLRTYVEHFKIHGVGVTAPPVRLDPVVARYAAHYEIEPSDSALGPTVAHSSYLYLIDQEGQVRYVFRYGEHPERIAQGVRQLMIDE